MPRQTELKRELHVAAGILQDSRGRVLIAERLGDGPFHGLWEFPGGKIGADESPREALQRELGEELGVTVSTCEHFMTLAHDYPDRSVELEFFLVSEWSPQPFGREGQRIRWVERDALAKEAILPADRPVIEALLSRYSV